MVISYICNIKNDSSSLSFSKKNYFFILSKLNSCFYSSLILEVEESLKEKCGCLRSLLKGVRFRKKTIKRRRSPLHRTIYCFKIIILKQNLGCLVVKALYWSYKDGSSILSRGKIGTIKSQMLIIKLI